MNSATLLSYSSGAYGPTITADAQSKGDLLIVRRYLHVLAEHLGVVADLGALRN
jgi:hypothetical protein